MPRTNCEIRKKLPNRGGIYARSCLNSRLLSGELHKQADSYKDAFLKSLYLAQLSVENYPYYRKRERDLNQQPIGELLERILALFKISYSQFENKDFEAQYLLQRDILEALVPVIRKHFDMDVYGRRDMPDLERIIDALENFRENHYLRIYAEEVLRKRYMESPPPGKTSDDIRKMEPDELIDLDMDIDSMR